MKIRPVRDKILVENGMVRKAKSRRDEIMLFVGK